MLPLQRRSLLSFCSSASFHHQIYRSCYFSNRLQLFMILNSRQIRMFLSFQAHATLMPIWWIRHLLLSQLHYVWKSLGMAAVMHEWKRSTAALIFFFYIFNFLRWHSELWISSQVGFQSPACRSYYGSNRWCCSELPWVKLLYRRF